jgi:hypothetical protein
LGSLAGVKSAVILVIPSQVIVTSGNVFEAYIPVTFTDNQPNPPDFPCYPIPCTVNSLQIFPKKKFSMKKISKNFSNSKKNFKRISDSQKNFQNPEKFSK